MTPTNPPAISFVSDNDQPAPRWQSFVATSARANYQLIVATFLLSVLDSVVLLAVPWPLGLLVDDVLRSGEPTGILADVLNGLGIQSVKWFAVVAAVATVVLVIAQQAIRGVTMVVNTRLTRRLTHRLGLEVLTHTFTRSSVMDSKTTVGDTVTRVLNDSRAAQDLVIGVVVPGFHALVTVVLMLIVMIRIEAGLSVLALAMGSLLFVSLRVHARTMTNAQYEAAEADGAVWAQAERTISALSEVQLAGAEPAQRTAFDRVAQRRCRAELVGQRSELAFGLTNNLVTAAGAGVLLILGGLAVLDGRMTVGELLIFNGYLAALFDPLNSLAYLGASYAGVVAHGRRLVEVFVGGEVIAECVSPVDLGGPVVGRVEFVGVWFGYDEGVDVLRDVSFEVGPGELVAVVGATGSGKSTLMSLLPRLMDVDGGCVLLDGVDVRSLPVSVVRGAVSVVQQEPLLLPVSIRENIEFARPGASFEEVWAAAAAANALEFIERLPDGFDTVLGERGDTLSGGQKQRLAIARALLKDSPVLILDEPTSALDVGTESLVVEALERVTRNRTVIMVTHRESAITNADRVVRLDHGRVVDVVDVVDVVAQP